MPVEVVRASALDTREDQYLREFALQHTVNQHKEISEERTVEIAKRYYEFLKGGA